MDPLPNDNYLYATIFLVGVLAGTLLGMYVVAFLIDKIHKRPKVRSIDDDDPADWWKRGGNPPGIYDDD